MGTALVTPTSLSTSITAGQTGHVAWGNTVSDTVNDLTAIASNAINVTDPAYGLTGTSDNTAAIQAALDAGASTGRPVLFPRRASADPYVVTGGGSGAILLKVAAGQVLLGDDSRPVIQVKAATGTYKSIIGGVTGGTDLTGLTIRNLTIDQNTPNNVVTSPATTLLTEGTQRFLVYVGAGDRITVCDSRFINIDALNGLYIGSGTMKDVRIQNNEFDVVGTSTARHDHSTIYTTADGQIITGNKLRGVLGGLGAASAIETHGPNQLVSLNVITNYYRAFNITGVTNMGNRDIVVTSNVCRNVMIGMEIWSYTGTNGGLVNTTISDNIIDLLRDSWLLGATDFPYGINVAASSTAHLENLKIRGNTITYQAFSTAGLVNEYQAAGIQLFTTDTSVELRNLDITDNLVVGALSAGLSIRMKVRGGTVARNRWVDCGSSTEAAMASLYKSGMVFVGDFADLDVYGNRTVDTRGTHKLVQGFATSISGSMVRGEQWDNTVICLDGTVLPEWAQSFGKYFGARAAAPVGNRFTTSLYYGPEGARSTVALADGTASAVCFWVSSSQTFDRIGCEVTTVGAAACVVRLGIYADNGSGIPGARVLDAGTVAGDSLGAKEITISQVLPAGLYWLVTANQGGAPTVRSAANNLLGGAGVSTLGVATGASPRTGYTATGVSGALPSTFTMGGQTALPGLVVLRAL